MKKFTLLIVFAITNLFLFAQTNEVKFGTIKKIADQTAQSLWGNISDGKVFPLYSKDDNIIAYRFNFSFDKPFPGKEALIEKCRIFYENGDKDSHWGIGKYGHIVISARKDMDVIQSYSDVLSPEYSERFKMRKLAQEEISGNVTLKKVYYINFENQWFCFTNGTDDIYVKVFPKPEAVNVNEFHKIVDNMKFFCETGDFSDKWDKYILRNILAGKSQVWIPNHDGYCKFYDWSYGCTPTAAAMLLSWWDFNSINTADNYSKLVDYNFQRYDYSVSSFDYQVPNVQKELAITMETDTLNGGGTNGWMIAPGFDQVCDDNGYNFFCQRHIYSGTDSLWYYNKIISEVGTYQRPILIEIPGHSECCVAYDEAAELIGVHNTWWGSVEWRTFTDVIRVYTVEAGGAFGDPVNLVSPLGDISYNGNGNGGSYGTNGMMEIKWNSDYANNTNLYYSMNGGYNWTTIILNTLNDGVYDWKIPSGINSQECRIKVEIKASDGALLGSDGSFGNFEIIPGGTIDTLESDNIILISNNPSYYQFSPDHPTWCVVGVGTRPDLPGEDWDVYLYDDNIFSNVIASSMYGEPYVDFVVLDGHKAPSQYWGVKFSQYSGIGNTPVEFENGNEILTIGDNPDIWPSGDVVEMYDVYLEPGSYEFGLDITSGTADLGFAIYSSSPSSYYGGRSSNLSISDNVGAGVNESFTVTVATADYYGLCVWSNDYASCDYNINIKSAGTWTGDINNDWHNPGNWVGGIVPDATMDVYLPNVTNKCWVYGSDAACKNLTIETGTGNYLRIYDNLLHVYGNMVINAQLMMDNSSGALIVDGNVDWNNNSTANFSASSTFTVKGHWYFNSGSNAQLADGMVYFMGTGSTTIKCKSPNCSFNSLYLDKGGSGSISVTSDSNNPLVINDDLYIQPGTSLINNYDQGIICRGDFWNDGDFNFSNGSNSNSFIMDGTTQIINMSSSNGLFNNIVLSPTTSVTLTGEIHIVNDLTIESGSFVPQANTILIGGNWINNVGPSAFIEDDSWVIFEGYGALQYVVGSEQFNIINVTNGAFITIDDPETNVECNFYQWTLGGINVITGSFTALDLANSGLYGTYQCYDGGIINLYQDASQYTDLNGIIKIYGGTMTVYGGNGPSWWPYQNDAALEMTGGVLDFPDNPIRISPVSFTLTENITGGTIRTAWDFEELRGDFTPEGGVIELYGNNNSYLSQTSGSNFYNVVINKSEDGKSLSGNQKKFIEYRDGTKVKATKGITVTADSNLVILHNFTIDAGIFDAPDLMEIGGPDGGDWVNNVTPEVFFEGTGTVIFEGEGYQNCTTEDFYNLVVNQQPWGYLTIGSGQTVACHSYRWLSGGIAATDGSFTANDLYDNGIFGNYFLNGSNAIINLYQDAAGWIDLNGNITIYDGEMNIYGGTDYSYWPLGNDVNLTMSGGILNFDTDFGIFLNSASAQTLTTNITGGTIRTPGSFYGNRPDFTPAGGTVELYGPNDVNVGVDGGSYFHNLLINKAATKGKSSAPKTLTDRNGNAVDVTLSQTAMAETDFTINESLTINEGTFSTEMTSVIVNQNVDINNGATYFVGKEGITGASLNLNNNSVLNVNSGGTLLLAGGGGYDAIISHTTGYYEFNVNAGGLISADTAKFEYMGTPYGINIKDGATIDPGSSFNFCEFTDGDPLVTNGALLTINNNQDLIIENSFFDYLGTYNLRKDVDQGSVLLKYYTGGGSGEDYDLDPYDRIDWFVPEFTITPTNFYFTPLADTAVLTIASNVEWTLQPDPWITLSQETGSENALVNVIVEENLSSNPRTGYIYAHAYGFPEQIIYVDQEGEELYVTPDVAGVSYEAGSMPFYISSNTNWTVYTTESWLSVNPTSGSLDDTVLVAYEENPDFTSRTADVVFSTSSGSVIIGASVHQDENVPVLSVTPSVQNVTSNAGTTTFDITSNTTWWANEVADWFDVSPGSDFGDGTLTVTYDENTSATLRSGQITLSAQDVPDVVVSVNQDGIGNFSLNLTAFLEGPFKTSDMGTDLNPALIPLNQPFNTAPWNYAGSESVISIPNTNVVDWVLVELRDASSAGGAGSSTRLARQAGFLLKDGSIVGTDGSSPLSFANSISNSLFVVVWHRNHLGIMSANALTESSGVYTYNFTTAVNKAYQSGQKSLNGKAVMYGGDVNANGTVNTTDKTIWSGAAGTKGYIPTDMNMDTQVDNKDKNNILLDNLNKETKVPN